MRSNIKTIILYAVLIIGIIIVASSVLRNINADTKLEYSEIIDLFYEDKVEKFEINSRNILTVKTIPEKTEDGQIIEGKTYTRTLRSLELFLYDIKDYLDGHREGKIQNLQTYDIAEPAKTSWLLSFLPYIIVIVVMIVFWIFIMNKSGSGMGNIANFGKSRARMAEPDKKRVLFSDVAGADEEKEELREIVEFLKNPDKYRKLGAKIPQVSFSKDLPEQVRPCLQKQ